jgi:Plasmid pRiA4b ORF-3-like protein
MENVTIMESALPTVHLLRITLMDVTPPVWRLLRVPSATPLSVLHGIVQVAMGWEDRHLHEWRVGDRTLGSAEEEDWGDEIEDESEYELGELAGPDSVLHYDYDLGDGWEHLVEVVGVEPYTATVPPVEVLDGSRSAPPEDSGGPSGYEHLLDALADPADPEHDEVVAWLGDSFTPEEFDIHGVNHRLESFWRT